MKQDTLDAQKAHTEYTNRYPIIIWTPMENNNVKRILPILLLLISITCNAQDAFTERLKVYYDNNTPKNDSLYMVIMRDTIIDKYGNYVELMQFVGETDLLYHDTLTSVYLIYKMHEDSFRKSIGLSNKDKNKILIFLSTVLLNSPSKDYRYNNVSQNLFDYNFWESFGQANDSILYNNDLINNLKQILKYKTDCLTSNTVRLLSICHLENLFAYVIKYAIKPYFESSTYTHQTNRLVWSHIYFLVQANNKEVLPYLYKTLSESGCKNNYHFQKYRDISELIYTINDMQVKKNILLSMLKDDCLFKLYNPTILRHEKSIPYFTFLILNFLMQYNNFPIEEVQKLSEKKQVEFVEKWIRKNM
jgi:hypothetical protein